MSMDEISTIPGKLLLVVYQMNKENEIDNRGKQILKGINFKYEEMIISNNPSILDSYENYIKDGTELTLRSALFRLQAAESKNSFNLE